MDLLDQILHATPAPQVDANQDVDKLRILFATLMEKAGPEYTAGVMYGLSHVALTVGRHQMMEKVQEILVDLSLR